jgi:hypothetical protein
MTPTHIYPRDSREGLTPNAKYLLKLEHKRKEIVLPTVHPVFGRRLKGREVGEMLVLSAAHTGGHAPVYKSPDGKITVFARGKIPVTFSDCSEAVCALLNHSSAEFEAALNGTLAYEEEAKSRACVLISDLQRHDRSNMIFRLATFGTFLSVIAGLCGRYGPGGNWTEGLNAFSGTALAWLILLCVITLFLYREQRMENENDAGVDQETTFAFAMVNVVRRMSAKALTWEAACSLLIASIVTPIFRFSRGFFHLFTWNAWLPALVSAFIVLDLTGRISTQNRVRDFCLAFAVSLLLLVLLQHRPTVVF